MKKLRVLSLLLALLTITPILSGCHGARKTSAFVIPEVFDYETPVEISFWAKNDTNINQTRIYEKAIEDFCALYPNIKVNLKLYTDYTRIYNDVITNIPTETTPNVCITYPDHIATYITGDNTVVALDTLFSDEKYGLGGSELKFDGVQKDEIIPKFLGECKIGTTHYALPYMRSTEACYVNKTYVEKLGYTLPETLTWDFIFKVAEAATEKDENGNFKVNGQKVMIPIIYKSTDNMMIQMLKQKNAGYSDARGNILLFNELTRDILKTVAIHAKTGAFSTFKISSYPANFLNAGQCIFAIDSTAGATWMGTNAPLSDISEDKLADFETEVMSIPQYDPENPVMISQGPSVCIFNKRDPQQVLASWLFAQYLLTNDVQVSYSSTEGYIPVTSKAQESDEYKDYLSREGEDNNHYYSIKLKAAKLLIENTDNTFVTPVFNGSAALRNAAGQLVESVTKSVRRKENVDEEYLDKLFADTISLYRLDSLSRNSNEKLEFGKLPAGAKVLIGALLLAWAGILAYLLAEKVRKKKK
ncbi:MAG: extracellular solute-binding protein [Clostridia bacterium]|nr:extracellular solute-binding protein [Clostridia bacterium]